MSFPTDNISKIMYVLRSLGPRAFICLFFSRLISVNHYYILGRNLMTSLEYPVAKKPIDSFSLITEEDIETIRSHLDSFDPVDCRAILTRLLFYKSGFTNCYVMKHGDDIALIQWIVFPTENHLIAQNYSNRYYPLAERQVMIENAFTFPRFRGRGCFLSGTLQLLELAKNKGYRSAICYVRKDRIMALNELIPVGFKIIKMVKEYKLGGKVWRTL